MAAAAVVLITGAVPFTTGKVLDVAAHRSTSMSAPPGFSHRIFEDAFVGRKLNTRRWNTYITSKAAGGAPWNGDGRGGSGSSPGGFNSGYFEPSQISVDNGLTLRAVRGSARAGFAWTSGVVSTYRKFQFDGGYVQIKAEVPGGDGMWPGLWMLPGPGGTGGDNYDFDIFEGNYIGNAVSPNDNYAWNLHSTTQTVGGLTNTGANLTAGYHVYGMNWIPGRSITWYLDGREVGQITKRADARTQGAHGADPRPPGGQHHRLVVAHGGRCHHAQSVHHGGGRGPGVPLGVDRRRPGKDRVVPGRSPRPGVVWLFRSAS